MGEERELSNICTLVEYSVILRELYWNLKMQNTNQLY